MKMDFNANVTLVSQAGSILFQFFIFTGKDFIDIEQAVI